MEIMGIAMEMGIMVTVTEITDTVMGIRIKEIMDTVMGIRTKEIMVTVMEIMDQEIPEILLIEALLKTLSISSLPQLIGKENLIVEAMINLFFEIKGEKISYKFFFFIFLFHIESKVIIALQPFF